jgi:hypothetical protein
MRRTTPLTNSAIRTFVVLVMIALLAIAPGRAAVAATNDFVGSATRVGNDGYWLVTGSGGVRTFGAAQWFGDMSGKSLSKPIVGMAATPTNNGYWLVASDGGIFAYGDAPFFGSMGGKPLNKPIVGMSSTPSNKGYWMVATDGGIFAFGDAQFFGSMGGQPLNKPIVGMSGTTSGKGYWLVATDGGIFAYGDAQFYGSTGSIKLNQPVVGMTTTPGGRGYWLAATDGGIFAFGDAQFHGAALSTGSSNAIAILRDPSGDGYSVVRSDGTYAYRGSAGSSNDVTSAWDLIGQDNFDGTSLNKSYWGVYNGTGNEGVGYRRPSAVTVGDGELRITGKGDVAGGICWCGASTPSQTYGRWEIRYRMDKGSGYGPAVLLWPDSEKWPQDGEIDISEIPKGGRTSSSFTIHYGADNSQVGRSDGGDFTQWHTYTLEWQPDHISFWLDGNLTYTTTKAAAIPKTPMHLALQNDVGAAGHWIPGRDASTPESVTMHVDYVKIFK